MKISRLKLIPEGDYRQLTDGAKTVESDAFGVKVLRLRDGTFLKLFRRKRWLSSAAIIPYSIRFVRNAMRLKHLRIVCPEPIRWFKVGKPGLSAVHYHPVAGETLRSALKKSDDGQKRKLLCRFGGYIAELHQKGIYFRSLHLGNVILRPDAGLGLIDISDLKIFRSPLDPARRRRNFRHLKRISSDRELLRIDDEDLWLTSYLASRTDG